MKTPQSPPQSLPRRVTLPAPPLALAPRPQPSIALAQLRAPRSTLLVCLTEPCPGDLVPGQLAPAETSQLPSPAGLTSLAHFKPAQHRTVHLGPSWPKSTQDRAF